MTGFSLIHHNSSSSSSLSSSSHTRSISDPPLIHPILLRLEEELHNLKASTSCTNSKAVSCALTKLCCLHMSINELFCITKNQQAIIHHRNEKWVEELMNDSVRFLDLISAFRECMGLMKEYIQGIRMPMWRRDESACVASEKILMKQIKCCSKMLRHYGDNDCKGSVFGSDWDLVMADKAMVDSREVVDGLFKSMLGLLLMPGLKMNCSKVGKWGSIVSKDGSECWKLEDSQLKELEESTEELDKGLEELFRTLIQNRVSLLNILSF